MNILNTLIDTFVGKTLKRHAALKLCALALVAAIAASTVELSQYEQFSTSWWLWLMTGTATKAFCYGAPIALIFLAISELIIEPIASKLPEPAYDVLIWIFGAGEIIAGIGAWLTLLGLPGTVITGCLQVIADSSFDVKMLIVYALGDMESGGITELLGFIRIMVALFCVFEALSIPMPKDNTTSIMPPVGKINMPAPRTRDHSFMEEKCEGNKTPDAKHFMNKISESEEA